MDLCYPSASMLSNSKKRTKAVKKVPLKGPLAAAKKTLVVKKRSTYRPVFPNLEMATVPAVKTPAQPKKPTQKRREQLARAPP